MPRSVTERRKSKCEKLYAVLWESALYFFFITAPVCNSFVNTCVCMCTLACACVCACTYGDCAHKVRPSKVISKWWHWMRVFVSVCSCTCACVRVITHTECELNLAMMAPDANICKCGVCIVTYTKCNRAWWCSRDEGTGCVGNCNCTCARVITHTKQNELSRWWHWMCKCVRVCILSRTQSATAQGDALEMRALDV